MPPTDLFYATKHVLVTPDDALLLSIEIPMESFIKR
jgi:hypothetical protein